MIRYHVHAINWNEDRMLPVFFRHYASASRIFIHDNESDESIKKVIKGYGADIVSFSTKGKLDDSANRLIKNSAWKVSRNSADYVIVQDLDELVHFPWMPGDICGALGVYNEIGITFAKSVSYWPIYSDEEWDDILKSNVEPWKLLKRGVRHYKGVPGIYDKVQVFDPSAIVESNYSDGAHDWNPIGTLKKSPDEIGPVMLHCKHIGMRHEIDRALSIGSRTSKYNASSGCGGQYQQNKETIVRNIESVYMSVDVTDISGVVDNGKMEWFTQNWSHALSETLSDIDILSSGRNARVLEIGSFEGRGTTMLANRFCKNEGDEVHCVDPLDDIYTKGVREFSDLDRLFVGQMIRFMFNTRYIKRKVRLYRGFSDDVIPKLAEEYDVVYIDGDHSPEQVYKDGVMALRVAKVGGYVIFDDYLWSHNGKRLRDGADKFKDQHSDCVDVLRAGTQLVLIVRKKSPGNSIAKVLQVNGISPITLETFGGSDAISSALLSGRSWEPSVSHYIAKYFTANRGSAFIELGANIGVHSILAAKAGALNVFAFECHPLCVSKLVRNAGINGCDGIIKVADVAASDVTGKVAVIRHVPGNVGASFIDSRENRFASQSIGTYKCVTERLDDHVFEPGVRSFKSVLVKIDVEGHELQAINGMRRLLSFDNVKEVVIEMNPETQSLSSLMSVLDVLASIGFRKYGLLLCVPADSWHGLPIGIDERPRYKDVERKTVDGLLANGSILELVVLRL